MYPFRPPLPAYLAEFLCRGTSLVAESSREASGEAAPPPKNYSIPANLASYAGYTHPLTFFTQGEIYLRYIFRTPMSKEGTYFGSLTFKTKHCSSIATMCCSNNRRCESSRVTSPLRKKFSVLFELLYTKYLPKIRFETAGNRA